MSFLTNKLTIPEPDVGSILKAAEVWQVVTLFVTFSRRVCGNIKAQEMQPFPCNSYVLLCVLEPCLYVEQERTNEAY
jgi:hypothetical protein